MATSWRSTRSSTSLAADVRHDSRTSPSTRQNIKYSNRSDTPGSCPTSDYPWSATQARLLEPPRADPPRPPGPGGDRPGGSAPFGQERVGCRLSLVLFGEHG